MKDAVLHTKTTFSKPLSWISYSKNYEIRQKRCLSSTYNNLYHYAANNPVKYTDPDGREDDYAEDVVRTVVETNDSFTTISESILQTDFCLGIGVSKHSNESGIKIEASVYGDNSVANEPKENSGCLSEYAFASSLTVSVHIKDMKVSETNVTNADENVNTVSINIPKTDNPIVVDLDIVVIAPNKKCAKETYNYEVVFK